MSIFKKKNRFKDYYREIAVTLIGFAIIVGISIPLARTISKRYVINKEISQLHTEIAGLENKNKDLKKMISYLESNEFVDEEARTNLNFKKPNEQVAVIIDSEKRDVQDIDQAEKQNLYQVAGDTVKKNKENKENNATRWWRYFFN